jgi:glycosyltransferase involved in cell wall biosynthesis
MKMIVEDFGVPRVKTHVVAQPVDELFWRPFEVQAGNLICAVGGEERDYPTLFRAVDGVQVDVEVAAGTVTWIESAEIGDQAVVPKGQLTHDVVPANVRVASRKHDGLRDLYARSRFVVVPVREVKFDAGVTALTEAMAMGKAVIATRTPGLADLFDDGEEGLFVPPGDAAALRAAIQRLLDDPAEAERMGRAGRARIERAHRLDAEMGAMPTSCWRRERDQAHALRRRTVGSRGRTLDDDDIPADDPGRRGHPVPCASR